MEERYENKAIYFTRAECDYLRNLVEQDMSDERSRKNEAPDKLHVWNILLMRQSGKNYSYEETGSNEG